MLKEKNPLFKIKLKKEELFITKIIQNIFEPIYSIFGLILKDPIKNFWYEYIGIIISYAQILLYLFDKTVSK